jgi:hypothetical protein
MGGVVTGEVTGVLGAPPFCVLVVPPFCGLVPELPLAPAVEEVDVDVESEPDADVEPEVDPGVDADVAVPEDPLSEPPQPLNKPTNATARAAARRLKINMAEP